MIEYTTGDLLSAKTEALVNTVNCVGVMGRGIALQFKKKFPDNFKAYATACKNEQVKPGLMHIYDREDMFFPRYIINFPTKNHWKSKSKMRDIESGLDDLVQVIKSKKISSIAIPPLGSGLGGLPWLDVKQKIEEKLASLEGVQILVYEPSAIAEQKTLAEQPPPSMTQGRAALLMLMQSYINGLLDPAISLLEVHKLMFFLQEAGEPLRLNYKKAAYGPYANNLRHVFNRIEGHYITGYQDGGDAPDKQIDLTPGVIQKAAETLKDSPQTQERMRRVERLVEGFETPYGLELLSTVYWVAKNESAQNLEQVIRQVHAWSERKKEFTPKQIDLAYQLLKQHSWLSNKEYL